MLRRKQKKRIKKERIIDSISRYPPIPCRNIGFDYRKIGCKDCAYWGDCWYGSGLK